jgi:hypothetical protein
MRSQTLNSDKTQEAVYPCELILHPTPEVQGEFAVGTNQDKSEKIDDRARSMKIDRTAPAGSENSLGAESVRDGRPATDDSTIEAIDEEGPGINTQS